jgi:predicted Zn-dependent protease
MIQGMSIRRAGGAVLAATLVSAAPAAAVNLFSVQQDVQVPMVRDGAVNDYVDAIVQRVAAEATGPRFNYQVKVVDAADINAFALPGGYIYVNRGLIAAARNESELAGVLAHEIAHVVERHGTENATKAYGAQAGVGILAQVLMGRNRQVGLPQQILGTLGLNAAFMKFSRDAENEADRVGAEMMSRAGYDPMAMATFFDLLQSKQRSSPNSVSQFFSSHPAPANRSANIRRYASQLDGGDGRRVGDLNAVQSRLERMPQPRRQASLRRG